MSGADEPGAEVLLDDEVDEQLARRRAALGGDVAERAADEVVVALERHLAHDEAAGVEAGAGHGGRAC